MKTAGFSKFTIAALFLSAATLPGLQAQLIFSGTASIDGGVIAGSDHPSVSWSGSNFAGTHNEALNAGGISANATVSVADGHFTLITHTDTPAYGGPAGNDGARLRIIADFNYSSAVAGNLVLNYSYHVATDPYQHLGPNSHTASMLLSTIDPDVPPTLYTSVRSGTGAYYSIFQKDEDEVGSVTRSGTINLGSLAANQTKLIHALVDASSTPAGVAGSADAMFDFSLVFTPIPEPSTYVAVAGTSLLAFAGWRRRRR